MNNLESHAQSARENNILCQSNGGYSLINGKRVYRNAETDQNFIGRVKREITGQIVEHWMRYRAALLRELDNER